MMGPLLPMVVNLILNWTWLGRHVASVKPFSVQVRCYDLCAPDELFKSFSANAIPWLRHDTPSSHSLLSDTVVIMADNLEKSREAIAAAAGHTGVHRARYILVRNSRVEPKDIQQLMSSGWSHGLIRIVVVQLEDKSIYTAQPDCGKPLAVKVPTVEWPDLRRLDLGNCVLKIAVSQIPPTLIFWGDNDSSLRGNYAPFYQYIKSGLKFQASLIATAPENLVESVILGRTDIAFTPLLMTLDTPLDVSVTYRSRFTWCVPDLCVQGLTTYLLWKEFTVTTWILLTIIFLAVCVSVHCMTPSKALSLVDSFFSMLATLASNPVKLYKGHVRWVLGAWLLVVLVLSTCYQTILHSMMTAPSVFQEIGNTYDLLTSNLHLIYGATYANQLKGHAKDNDVASALMTRAKEANSSSLLTFMEVHQQTHSVYITLQACSLFKEMKPLEDNSQPVQMGLFRVVNSSWLAPALHRIGLQLEASGLASVWFGRNRRKASCSSVQNKELQPITVALLWPAIVILICGYTLSFLAFLVELLWHHGRPKIGCNFR